MQVQPHYLHPYANAPLSKPVDPYDLAATTKPARKQAALPTKALQQADVSGFYNIWYHKIAGDYANKGDKPEKASSRCDVLQDAGWTKGEKGSPICFHFAKGRCTQGEHCNFLHRRPLPEDDKKCTLATDIFGRERHRTDRDDMNGVGNFSRDQRSLYISGLRMNVNVNLEKLIWDQFKEWGEIEYVRVIRSKAIAFVKYKYRCSAEFAKEAMAEQEIGHDEQLSIRWAREDPNPRVKQMLEQEAQATAMAALLSKYGATSMWEHDSGARYQYNEQGQMFAQQGLVAYPDTDAQYSQESSLEKNPEGYYSSQAYYDYYYSQQGGFGDQRRYPENYTTPTDLNEDQSLAFLQQLSASVPAPKRPQEEISNEGKEENESDARKKQKTDEQEEKEERGKETETETETEKDPVSLLANYGSDDESDEKNEKPTEDNINGETAKSTS